SQHWSAADSGWRLSAFDRFVIAGPVIGIRRPCDMRGVTAESLMQLKKRICIVTNAPISQNPRVVKEADALSAAGYDVLVLFAQHAEWTRPLDRYILDQARWRGHAIEFWPSGTRRLIRRLILATRLSIFCFLSKFSMAAPIAELAYSRFLLRH